MPPLCNLRKQLRGWALAPGLLFQVDVADEVAVLLGVRTTNGRATLKFGKQRTHYQISGITSSSEAYSTLLTNPGSGWYLSLKTSGCLPGTSQSGTRTEAGHWFVERALDFDPRNSTPILNSARQSFILFNIYVCLGGGG